MAVRDQIKAFRKSKKYTQVAFGDLLGCGRDTIANYETGRVDPPEPFIQLLCSKFSINEHWLRTGEGEMMEETEDTLFAAFAKRYDLSVEDQAVARYLLGLSSSERQAILRHIRGIADAIRAARASDPVQEEVEAYRQELLAEQKAATLSASADSDGEKRA